MNEKEKMQKKAGENREITGSYDESLAVKDNGILQRAFIPSAGFGTGGQT